MKNDKLENFFLQYAEMCTIINKANIEVEKLTLKNQITAGRHFRKEMRELKKIISEIMKTSLEIDDDNRKLKDEKDKD